MVDSHGYMSPVFRYAVISDTHLRPSGESSSPWKTNLLTNDRARWVAHTINAHSPDLVIHLGDIVHPVPHARANRVAEAVVAGYAHPGVRILLDTFMDHDRGYFPRAGLYDRRLNPRRAALVLRHLTAAVNAYGTDITVPNKQAIDGWTAITFH
jgi:3',5'-cyclic AMP phosphodiesterase CpdA